MRGLSKANLILAKTRQQISRATNKNARWHNTGGPTSGASVNVVFLQPDGETRTAVQAFVGETLLQTAHRNEIDLEGACEGGTSILLNRGPRRINDKFCPYTHTTHTLYTFRSTMLRTPKLANGFLFQTNCFIVSLCTVCACSTCHLILPQNLFHSLPEPSEDEEDMLDMAFGLTETSRLGCQITVTSDMEGVVLEMPKATRNFYVDGHKPKPH